jgi:hypothetical protein
MTRDEYWHIIDETPPGYEARLDALAERFSQLPTEALFEFYHEYVAVLVESLRWDLYAAAGVFADGWEGREEEDFDRFRFWLILQGRRPFEAAMADPDNLADVVAPDDGLPEGLNLLHLIDEAYRNRTGRDDFEEEFRRRYPLEPCDYNGEQVGDSWEELQRRFPRLCAAYKSCLDGAAEPGAAPDPARDIGSGSS